MLTVIGPIDLLAYGTIFTREMFARKKSLFFSPRQKAQDVCREVVSA